MNNYQPVDAIKITKRIFIQYFPVWILYTFFTSLLLKQVWGMEGFVSNFIGMLGRPAIMYIFAILPVIFFKNMPIIPRRICFATVCLIVMGIDSFMHLPLVDDFSFNRPLEVIIPQTYGLMIDLTCVIVACWFYFMEEKQYMTETKTIAEENIKANNEKKVTETYLKLLQAQIEPHFLFNTLTSILVLSEKEPQKAKIMHDNFMQYLKATLEKTRASITTVGQDLELIRAYLDIFKVRMGKRLQFSIEADGEIVDLPFPSMLIQPIVENAIRHGLEPKIDGGEIRIKVTKQEGDRLRWEIEDTGTGMSEKADMGTGLSNVIERIETLYGKDGHFSIKDNKPSGVKVTLEVPYTYV